MGPITEFIIFKPKIYHFSDGDPASDRAKHLNIGKGGFNIIDFLFVISEGGF